MKYTFKIVILLILLTGRTFALGNETKSSEINLVKVGYYENLLLIHTTDNSSSKEILESAHTSSSMFNKYAKYMLLLIISLFLIFLIANWFFRIIIRKKIKDLRESEMKYKSLFSLLRLMADNVPDMIWAKNLEKCYTFANKTLCEKLLLCENTDEPLGKTDLYFAERQRKSHPENQEWHTFGEICSDSDSIVMKNREPEKFEEFGNIKGKFLFLDVHKAPFWDESGDMIGTVGSARDVTKEKKLEDEKEKALEELKKREAFNFALFTYNPIETLVVNKEGEIVKTNIALRHNMSQLPDFGVLMYKDYAASHDIDMRSILMKAIKTGKSQYVPETLYRGEKILTINITPFSEGAIITSQDITERKKAEKQIEMLNRVFEQLGTDPVKNINFIVEKTNSIHKGVCSLYNRLDDKDKSLIVRSANNLPEDFNKMDKPDGHICYEATIKGGGNIITIEDLTGSKYEKSDPNVSRYGLKSYLGYPVKLQDKTIGSLCIVDIKTRHFSENEINIISTLAKALSIEEERKLAEEKLLKSLNEKDILLKEIHHRVKNNMQIISSLLKLQSRNIKNESVQKLFQNSQNRVRTMALIHEKLYASSDFTKIDFKAYVNTLINYLSRDYHVNTLEICFDIDIDQLYLNINSAIPLGLIVNELVTNSMKYAFPDRDKGEIRIIMKHRDDRIQLTISDNGVGLPESFKISESNTLGLELVKALIDQLHGNLEISRKGGGTTFLIDFSEKK